MRGHNTRWWNFAACRGKAAPDDNIWFSGRQDEQAEAKRICRTCSAFAACLEDSMATTAKMAATRQATSDYGIFAALTPEERAELLVLIACTADKCLTTVGRMTTGVTE